MYEMLSVVYEMVRCRGERFCFYFQRKVRENNWGSRKNYNVVVKNLDFMCFFDAMLQDVW